MPEFVVRGEKEEVKTEFWLERTTDGRILLRAGPSDLPSCPITVVEIGRATAGGFLTRYNIPRDVAGNLGLQLDGGGKIKVH